MSAVRQAITAFLFLLMVGNLQPTLNAQDVIDNRKPTLEERLTFGLRVRTADEKKFIKKIVGLVNIGKLDQKYVDQAFFWVQREIKRKQEGDPKAKKHIEKYPFFYFKQIVKLNAKRAGVVVPD